MSSLDCDELTTDVTSFDVQDLHCSLDSDKREMYVTSSQMSSYMAEQVWSLSSFEKLVAGMVTIKFKVSWQVFLKT